MDMRRALDNDPVVTGCTKLHTPLSMPSQKDWILMRKAYASTVEGYEPTEEDLLAEAMWIPYQVGYDPIRGRGVYATKPISSGNNIWASTQVAEFKKPKQFVRFLKELPHRLQCDILLWAYPYHGRADVDLDVGSLINHGDTEDVINMDNDGRATRDIQAGEFIVMNYTEFIEYNSVEWFDEIRNQAWKPDSKTEIYSTTSDYNRLGAPVDDAKSSFLDDDPRGVYKNNGLAVGGVSFLLIFIIVMQGIPHLRPFFCGKRKRSMV